MIVQIRGTSGSGKTHAMRAIMRELSQDREWKPFFREGRKNPMGYELFLDGKTLKALGHYESPCGGCDNVGSARQVYDLIQAEKGEDTIILSEGLLLSEDFKWTVQMPGVRVYFLVTPLETCLERIGERRRRRGAEKPLDPKNTTQRVKRIESARRRLSEAGTYCRRIGGAQVVSTVLDLVREDRCK